MSDSDWKLKREQYKVIWLSCWALLYGSEYTYSDVIWALKDSISEDMGNRYSLSEAMEEGFVTSEIKDGVIYYSLHNWS